MILRINLCDFCGKSQRDAKMLVKGLNAMICAECVLGCSEIILENQATFENRLKEIMAKGGASDE